MAVVVLPFPVCNMDNPAACVTTVTGVAPISGCYPAPMSKQMDTVRDMEKTCAFNGGTLGGYRIESEYDKAGNITRMVCTFPNKTTATLNFCKATP